LRCFSFTVGKAPDCLLAPYVGGYVDEVSLSLSTLRDSVYILEGFRLHVMKEWVGGGGVTGKGPKLLFIS
jgi:hypothetical protein